MANVPGYLDFQHLQGVIGNVSTEAVSQGASKALVRALERLEKAVVNNPVETSRITLAANERLAHSMRTAVLHSYDQVVTAQKRVPSYREDDTRFPRFAGGKLRNALESSANYVATSRGIKFIDIDHMDEAAAQWYRLNFGAAPQGGRAPYAFNLLLEGISLGSVELAWAPSQPFRLPSGFFTEEGAFYPGPVRDGLTLSRKIGRNTPTRGIAPRRFLDAGLDRLSKDFPTVYGDVLIQVKNQKLDKLPNL